MNFKQKLSIPKDFIVSKINSIIRKYLNNKYWNTKNTPGKNLINSFGSMKPIDRWLYTTFKYDRFSKFLRSNKPSIDFLYLNTIKQYFYDKKLNKFNALVDEKKKKLKPETEKEVVQSGTYKINLDKTALIHSDTKEVSNGN